MNLCFVLSAISGPSLVCGSVTCWKVDLRYLSLCWHFCCGMWGNSHCQIRNLLSYLLPQSPTNFKDRMATRFCFVAKCFVCTRACCEFVVESWKPRWSKSKRPKPWKRARLIFPPVSLLLRRSTQNKVIFASRWLWPGYGYNFTLRQKLKTKIIKLIWDVKWTSLNWVLGNGGEGIRRDIHAITRCMSGGL